MKSKFNILYTNILLQNYNQLTTKIEICSTNEVKNVIFNYYIDYYKKAGDKKILKKVQSLLFIDKYDMKFVKSDFADMENSMQNEKAIYFICLDAGHLVGVLKYFKYTDYTNNNPCLEYISIKPDFKHQKYGIALLNACFNYHKENYPNKILFITEFSGEGELYVKPICQNLALKYNIEVFGTYDYEILLNNNKDFSLYDFKPTKKIIKLLKIKENKNEK